MEPINHDRKSSSLSPMPSEMEASEVQSSDPPLLSELEEEISAVNAIFTPTTLTVSTPISSSISPNPSDTSSSLSSTYLILALPTIPISLLLCFPPAYPSAIPTILSLASISASLPKGIGPTALSLARSTLCHIWHEGEVCIYDLITELESALASSTAPSRSSTNDQSETSADQVLEQQQQQQHSTPIPDWIITTPTVEKKSVFQARVCTVSSPAQALAAVSWLRTNGERKLAKATHHIWAYRIREGRSQPSTRDEVLYQDCDDDGETGAAAKVLGVMQAMDVWGVLVVVSRWYGGIKLGPDRFRIIGAAAREVVVEAGWGAGGAGSKGSERRGGKRKG